MIIDYTIPLWGVITYLLGTIAVVAGFVYKVITLEFKQTLANTRFLQIETELQEQKLKSKEVEQKVKKAEDSGYRIIALEKDAVLLKDKITEVEWGQKNEIQKMQMSIADMVKEFHRLNINLAKCGFKTKKDIDETE